MKDTVNQLKNLPLFAGLSEKQVEEISRLVVFRKYPKGRFIFMENEPGEAVYLLKSGRVKIFKQDEDGREHILHYINPGEIFAEVVLFDGGNYPASSEVMEDAEIGLLFNREIDEFILKHPEFALSMLKVMARRLRVSQNQIMELALKDTTRRMVSLLLELAHEHGIPDGSCLRISLSFTNRELANMIGTSRETANRILGELKRNKAISIGPQNNIFVNVDKLKTWM